MERRSGEVDVFMRILGIDPGLRLTGYGCVELRPTAVEPTLVEAGVLRLDADQSMEHRLVQLYDDLSALFEELQPQRVAVEKLYAHYKHPRTAIMMGHARGVILLVAQQHEANIEHLPSTAVKKAFTGHGHASKRQIQLAVQSQFKLAEPPSPPDVADAIAIATTCARRHAIDRLTS